VSEPLDPEVADSLYDDRRRPEVDYRYTLADERTLLAWIRTALALEVAGLGLFQFADKLDPWLRRGASAAFILLGVVVAGAAYPRSRAGRQAMREGRELSPPKILAVVALAVAVVGLAVGIAALFVNL
jgi:putative membrane protein